MIKFNGENADSIKNDVPENKDTPAIYFLIKRILSDAQLPLSEAVRRMGKAHPEKKSTLQNISAKISRDSISFTEVAYLAEVCGYALSFDRIKSEQPIQKKMYCNPTYNDLLLEGYADCDSVNFDLIIIAGANAEQAAKWISENLDSEFDETQEIMILLAANRQFKVNCKPVSKNKNVYFEMK